MTDPLEQKVQEWLGQRNLELFRPRIDSLTALLRSVREERDTEWEQAKRHLREDMLDELWPSLTPDEVLDALVERMGRKP